MSLRLLAIGEGPGDIGRDRDKKRAEELGVALVLVERILGRPVRWTRHSIHKLRVRRKRSWKGKGKLSLMRGKLEIALVIAAMRGVDGVVIVSDRLKGHNRDDWDKARRAIRGNASEEKPMLPCAIGVAIPEIEAWLVADMAALKAVLGAEPKGELRAKARRIETPRSFGSAKELWSKILEASETERAEPELRLAVAKQASLGALSHTCPKGFGPFRRDVEEEIAGTLPGDRGESGESCSGG